MIMNIYRSLIGLRSIGQTTSSIKKISNAEKKTKATTNNARNTFMQLKRKRLNLENVVGRALLAISVF
jgi:hypothetical protein